MPHPDSILLIDENGNPDPPRWDAPCSYETVYFGYSYEGDELCDTVSGDEFECIEAIGMDVMEETAAFTDAQELCPWVAPGE